MPTLHWIGKDKVQNHHLDVPFRALQKQYTHGDAGSGNRIIHGDNLEALKALLPEYEGRVKCIYIDPPYNTGNEGWAYNDAVNDPKILRWLHKTVGKEGEDLSRHDKWLCMMYPRLRLLHKLLADDGAIFISIDDNEQAHLRLVLDEIFGAGNFVATVIWQKVYAPKNSAQHFSEDHDFIMVFAKNASIWRPNLLARSEEQDKVYQNRDNDPRGLWRPDNLSARNFYSKGSYSIKCPGGRVIAAPPAGSYWRVSEEKFWELDADNRIYWGKDGNAVPSLKRFLTEVKQGRVPQTLWTYQDVGHTQDGKKDLVEMMSFEKSEDVFITPKPASLIERILQIATAPDSLILDSFAGSGTTAHAVLNLNQQDGGSRKFILIEMEDYAETLTAERVRRVMAGYAGRAGTGGGFDFCTLGAPLFLENGLLNEAVGAAEIRKYVWHAETGQSSGELSVVGGQSPIHRYFLGSHEGTAWWFCYERERAVALDLGLFAEVLAAKTGEATVVYADYCTVPDALMQARNVRFKKIPRD
ncbi:MAG: site-specific DNA-methyltransferase, partial [Saprospiraceae bacterium]